MALEQKPRKLGLTTPLGDNELLLVAFRGEEEMSRLFRYELEMISDNNAIAAADIVGKNVGFSVTLADGSARFFNGFVNRFYAGDEGDEGRRNYRAEVVPWLWFLTRTTDCRIFQNKTVPQIVEQIFADLGFSDFEIAHIKGEHPKRDYCVQYRESDFDFVSRLLEEEGIFYFFKHEDGKHTLVMADHTRAYQDCPENRVDYPRDHGSQALEDHITGWEHRYEFRSGKWAQTDYNFETPSANLMTKTNTVMDLPGVDKYEQYDFPGEYGKTGDGEPLTKTRMEEEEVEHDVVHATSLCKTFTPGGKFKIGQHQSDSEAGRAFVITSIQHSAAEPMAYETGSGVGETYANRFTCIPDTVIFRPARTTPRPIVRGPQTAVVVGPVGAEIYPDKYGRVKVQFHWDREGKKDENSSCWIRVSQPVAGQGWGAIVIPRIGQEVIVEFIEGDPDAPIITGRVYNAGQMPPYELPANKTQSGFKSRSSMGGSADNFNEIRFEDKKGSEQLFIHAEKNQDIEVENDETHSVGHDRTKTIDNDETTHVKHDRTETVDNNETITIGVDRTENVGKNESITVGLMRTRAVGVNEAITVGAAQEITVGGLRAVTVGLSQTLSVGMNLSESIGKNRSETVGSNRTSSVGKDDSLKVGKNLVIDAGDQIVIKTGKASITMKKDGTIQISGKDITIKASGKINAKASKNIILKGKKILQN